MLLNDCKYEIKQIEAIIKSVGKTSNEVPFLTRYALIKAHGTIEQCYKNLISEICDPGATPQLKKYFEKNFRGRASRLNYCNIISELNYFDDSWGKKFKSGMDRFSKNRSDIISSVNSLVVTRNQFAHGESPQITFRDIKKYFLDAEKMIRCLKWSIN